MATKKKIEERLRQMQARKAERRMRMFGLGVILLVLLLLGLMFLRNEGSVIPESSIPAQPIATANVSHLPTETAAATVDSKRYIGYDLSRNFISGE